MKTLSPTPTPPASPRSHAFSLRGSYTALNKDSSPLTPKSSPYHRSSLGNFRSAFESEFPKNYELRNGLSRSHLDSNSSQVKLPLWDQASADFYFARSRDLLMKTMTPMTNPRGSQCGIEKKSLETSKHSLNSVSKELKRSTNQLFDSRRHQESNEFLRLKSDDSNKYPSPKANGVTSILCKEVPANGEGSPLQVTLRKCGSKGHLRRRSYNDWYLSSSSSDSSDSFNTSENERQMSHRMKMRKQRRAGSFSSGSRSKSPQVLLNSPPPQNSFLNSITSPKNTSTKGKFYFANLKPVNPEPEARRSMNNLSVNKQYSSLHHTGFEEKWPERARDSSTLTFTSSNSSSLNWEEYLELDREFLSCNNCPPSPAPQV